MVLLLVIVFGHKAPSCWHKVVIVNKYSFCLCETTYEEKEITQLQDGISQKTEHNKKTDSQLKIISKWIFKT